MQVVDFDAPDALSEPLLHMASTVFSTAAYTDGAEASAQPSYYPDTSVGSADNASEGSATVQSNSVYHSRRSGLGTWQGLTPA